MAAWSGGFSSRTWSEALRRGDFAVIADWFTTYFFAAVIAGLIIVFFAAGFEMGAAAGLRVFVLGLIFATASFVCGWLLGLPHSLPLPEIAVELLESIETNAAGYYFPHRYDPDRPAIYTSPNKWCAVHAEETGIPQFTPRDLRRTWKTLAGRAGVSKEMRDRLQNHVQQSDVSTRHYDRYDYLRERREAMKQWDSFMKKILSDEMDEKKDSILREAAE